MGAAIWSMPPARLLGFPAASFIAFFENHRLLHWDRPSWRTVTGGSRRFVEKLTAPFRDRIRLRRRRDRDQPRRPWRHRAGFDRRGRAFRQGGDATHSDQALALLADASPLRAAGAGRYRYRPNDVWLHTAIRR